MTDRAIDAAVRICQAQMDAIEGRFPMPPKELIADAFVVAESYLKLCVATGRHVA